MGGGEIEDSACVEVEGQLREMWRIVRFVLQSVQVGLGSLGGLCQFYDHKGKVKLPQRSRIQKV